MYKAVIFDLDDTLYDYETINKIATEKLRSFTCKKFSVTEDVFNESYSWAKIQTKALLGETGSSHNRMLYCQKTLEKLNKNPVDGALEMYDCYWNSMLSDMKLRDGTIPLLKKLKSDGIKIAVCTDLTVHIQHRKLQKLGLVPFLDALVTSEEAGAEKPAGKMYSLVFEKLSILIRGLQKSDCLFVGDSKVKDVEGPHDFGINSLLFTDMKNLEKHIYG